MTKVFYSKDKKIELDDEFSFYGALFGIFYLMYHRMFKLSAILFFLNLAVSAFATFVGFGAVSFLIVMGFDGLIIPYLMIDQLKREGWSNTQPESESDTDAQKSE